MAQRMKEINPATGLPYTRLERKVKRVRDHKAAGIAREVSAALERVALTKLVGTPTPEEVALFGSMVLQFLDDPQVINFANVFRTAAEKGVAAPPPPAASAPKSAPVAKR